MHECMSDYVGGILGTTETSSGTGGGEGCDGGGVGAENGWKL